MFNRNIPWYLSIPFLILLPFITLVLVEWLQGAQLDPLHLNFWINAMIYFGMTALVFALTRRVFLAAMIPMVLSCLLGAVNHFMIAMRGKALLPWDLFALGTAQNVAGGLALKWDTALVVTVLSVLACGVAAWCMRRVRLPRFSRAVAAVLAVLCLGGAWQILWDAPDSISSDPWYTADASKQNGMAANLMHNTKLLINLPPEGYSTARVRETIGNGAHAGTRQPDIIVVMDETFSDLSHIADLQTNADPIPFIHSLMSETVSGFTRVSVFGGGTCNTEYDFLTGNSSAMLRPGCYPMVQFTTNDTPSIAQTLRSRGYRTAGVHPFYPDGWNRDQAYPRLGFDRFYSIHDFNDPELVREYISDRASFQKVLTLLDESAQPAFIFNVTMQNHSGYAKAFDNLEETITFPEMEEFPQARRYLSLLAKTDTAVRELVEALKQRERPTILLFFGDHLPALEDGYYRMLQERAGISDTQMDEKKHDVPFFIWANFPIEARQGLHISASFLAPLLLHTADAPMSAYQSYLYRLMQQLPIIQNDGSAPELGYRIAQHNMVFDLLGRQDDLFQ